MGSDKKGDKPKYTKSALSKKGFLSSVKRPTKTKKHRKKSAAVLDSIATFLFYALIIFVVASFFYAYSVTDEIREKLEGKKWLLPSQVYAQGFIIFPGQDIEKSGLVETLLRLNYRPSVRPALTLLAGEFKREGTSFYVHVRSYHSPLGDFKDRLMRLDLNGDAIATIFDESEQKPITLFQLEPELFARLFGSEREERDIVRLDEVPPYLVNAIIAIEDKRFYSHIGVDPIAIARAMAVNLIHFKFTQGGSTITQQLVKNMYLTPERTITRKVKEAIMALVLEALYDKKHILESYINEVYFAQSYNIAICGVGEAARFFFGKDVRQLDLAESALLAGLIRSPAGYSPKRNIERAKLRRDVVLNSMLKQGLIKKDNYERAKKKTIDVWPTSPPKTQAPYFVDLLRRELTKRYPPEILVSEGLKVYTTLDLKLQEYAERALSEGIEQLEKSYPSLKRDDYPLQAAIVAVRPQNGYIVALVGGRDFSKSQFNRAVMAERQPGSAFKIFTYLAAFTYMPEELTPATIVPDEPLHIKVGKKIWSPKNFGDKTYGQVTVRQALEQSINRPTVWIAQRVGFNHVIDMVKRAGIKVRAPYPSVTLGAVDITLSDLAQSYTALANGGRLVSLKGIDQVSSHEDEILESQTTTSRQVLNPEAAFLVNYILMGVFDRGTAKSARAMGFEYAAAGKTGTTDDNRDSWFVGYTPELLCAVWVGFDDNKPTGLTGATGALPIWVAFMKRALADETTRQFTAPRNIIFVEIDPETGQRARAACPTKLVEAFIEGTEPKDYCEKHKLPF